MSYCRYCRTNFTEQSVRICINADEAVECIAQQIKTVTQAQSKRRLEIMGDQFNA
jgi:NAD-dependent DNA ligase